MELRTIVGCYELEDRQGENKDIVFKLVVPASFTWEMLHAAIGNFGIGAKEWESMNKKKQEDIPADDNVQSASGVIEPEVVA